MVPEMCHTHICTYLTKPHIHTPSELCVNNDKCIIHSQTSSYGIPAVLSVVGYPPYHTQSPGPYLTDPPTQTSSLWHQPKHQLVVY